MRLVLFGPPGAGKGTQANLLGEDFRLMHISTGELFRAAIKAGTPLGLRAQSFINQGKLAPDEIVRELAEEALANVHLDNFILDGYPRTVQQAEWLTDFLDQHEAPLDAVISLHIDPDVMIERLSKRRVNLVTGESYHLDFIPPPEEVDPAQIFQRDDDRPEAIMERLEVYRRETEPLGAYFKSHANYFEIDGQGEIEEVYSRVREAVVQAMQKRRVSSSTRNS